MPKRKNSISNSEQRLVESLVAHYNDNYKLFDVMLKQLGDALRGSASLMIHVHSTKERLKDPDHLRKKLVRKILTDRKVGARFGINKDNLFQKINDLAGFRILHLHTKQIVDIDKNLKEIFAEYRYGLIEGPTARTWDDESREFFRTAGIQPVESPTMYTSVHYIIKSGNRTGATCEIQVRTLAEELWGEVDHMMNYPVSSPISACREQIKVLARVTSSCSRLVDSIFHVSTTGAMHSAKK